VVVVVELVVEVVVVGTSVVVVVGTVVVVVVTVVVVVGTVVVVVVVAPAHELAAHFPGPMLTPPWAAHFFAERIAHTLPWQQRTCAASARGTGPASTRTIADMKMKPRTLRLVVACIIGVLPAPRSGGIRDRRFVAPRLLNALLATSARSATGGRCESTICSRGAARNTLGMGSMGAAERDYAKTIRGARGSDAPESIRQTVRLRSDAAGTACANNVCVGARRPSAATATSARRIRAIPARAA